MDTKICSKCKKELPITEFYSRGNGRYRSECKTCHKDYVKSQYAKRKEFIAELKKEYGCKKCGDTRPYVLDFHHINPDEKEETIARLSANSTRLERVEEEINKCVVLCANCHREFHYLNETTGITLEEYLQ